jgi:methylenetetrahydrofolate reductase (NADPH)
MFVRDRLAHKRPVFSFEFFPPKTEESERVLWRSLQHLAPLQPDFVSVTYGAGGSTRARTVDLVCRIKRELGIEAVAHLTCVGATRDEIAQTLDKLAQGGICNVLALRGDPPKGEQTFVPAKHGFRYAHELVAFIRERGDFCIGAACYPEVHPEAADAAADLRALKTKVDAGADFLVTQLFFDNRVYFDFVAQARSSGINVPILPGVMPITTLSQIDRLVALSGACVPSVLRERVRECGDEAQEVFWAGVSYAANQCRRLIHPDVTGPFALPEVAVPGIHFYTMNRSPATRAIFEMLQLNRAAF